MKKSPLFSSLLLMIPLVIFSCGQADTSAPPAAPASPPAPEAVPDRVVGLAEIQPEDKTVNIYPQLSGIITEVNVKIGDKVKKGRPLFVLDHQTQEADLAVVQAQIKEQEATIRNLESNLGKAKLNTTNLERTYQRAKTVFDQGAGTKADLDNAETAWQAAQQDVDAALAGLDNARARLGELSANLRLARIALDKYFIKAPADGLIMEVDGAVGASVGPTSLLGEFAPESPTDAVTEIDELFADRVQLHQPAYIRKPGSLDTLAVGQVVELAPSLRQKSLFSDEVGNLEDRRVREVKVRITKGQEQLLFGQRVECVILVKN